MPVFLRSLVLLIPLSLLVAGCAKNYQLPESANSISTIHLDLESQGFRAGDVAEIYHIDEKFECGKPSIKYPRLVKISKFSIAGQSNSDGLKFETSDNFRVLVRRVGNENSLTAICDRLLSFSPQKARIYRFLSSLDAEQCDVKILEGDKAVEIDLIEYTAC